MPDLPPVAPLSALRQMVHCLTPALEDAIDSHGFVFSAFSGDGDGAHLDFIATGPEPDWHLTLSLDGAGLGAVTLRQGMGSDPPLLLRLPVDGRRLKDIESALVPLLDVLAQLRRD